MNQQTDTELIQQTLNGESEAFGHLIQRYQDAVYATALHRVKDFATAQDIAQEAFIEAYKGLHALREYDKFPGWLHTITLRQCNRWQRKQRESMPIGDLPIGIAENGSPPDEELERQEIRRMVLNIISSLPEKSGEVVTMYYMDGLSYNEIASFLSVPASTVKGRLQMGRKRLKEGLITMVEDGLKQNRPDQKFTEEVLAEIVEQASEAWENERHDETLEYCEKALEVLDHLGDTEKHMHTRMEVLRWQAHEWLLWYGKPKEAIGNYQRATQIAADTGDLESQAKWLLSQVVAISDTGNYEAMRKPLQDVREIYGKLGDIHGQTACDAAMELIDLLPAGWEQDWTSQGEHTSYGSKRYSLKRSEDSLTYIADPPPKKRSLADLRLASSVRRGFYVFGFSSLLGRLGEFTQILNLPPVVGDSWSGQIEIRSGESLPFTSTIESNSDTVVVPAGRFENCLRVVVVAEEPADADFSDHIKTYLRRITSGKRLIWFAPGVGMVKYCHYSDWGAVYNIQLTEYQIEDGEKDDYFPISANNRWKYERFDGESLIVTESYRVTARGGEEAHIACAMYSKLLDSSEQRNYFQSCIEYAKVSDGDPDAEAWALAGLGSAHAHFGDMKASLEAYRQADESATNSENIKRQFDILYGTDWLCEPEFVLERYDQASEIAKKMGDLERQNFCLGNAFCFALRHQRGKWYSRALNAAQRRIQVAAKLGDHAQMVSVEAMIDLARSLIADPEGKNALNGGNWFVIGVEAPDEGGLISEEFGVGHGYDRPFPPICNYQYWLDSPFLKLPVEVGAKWRHNDGHRSIVERIVESDSEMVDVPAGKFDRVVRVKSIFQTRIANEGSPQANAAHNCKKQFRDGEKWMWFAPGVGIIKVEHHHINGKRTIIELTDYHLEKTGGEYLPLAIGNRWNYEWRNENGDLLFKEQHRAVSEHEGKYYLAVSGYTTNTAEYGEHQYG